MKKQLQAGVVAALMASSVMMSSSAHADQVFAQDVIIQGSLCTGVDCVNGETFSFDTLILKENNLRIFFKDTSNSSSFPNVDWRLIANETTNGGQNMFAIEDSTSGTKPLFIQSSAPNNTVFMSGNGNVGFRTSTPAVSLHTRSGNSPALRLEQDSSGGFTSQTWDVAGNETNFFIRDVTNAGRIPFKIAPGAPANSLFIANNGRVGLGTSTPDGPFQVENGGGTADDFIVSSSGFVGIGTNNPTVPLEINATGMDSFLVTGDGVKLARLESSNNSAVQFRFQTNNANRRFVALDGSGSTKTQIELGNTAILLAGPTVTGADLWAKIDANGIVTQGPTCNPGPCDGVFDQDLYEVETIEEHADYMWKNKHLWGVGPTAPDQPFNVTEKTAGVIHELEKAHIYIEQLNKRISALELELDK
ncbi:hypothetical protein [Breoghania sp.]|uniref:hypothetical protein n=1 Tax=Breoghania sp. TaxID=2065378 RepID=UPI002AA864D8|nr:hypothetical protein [Breoghania sp.]